MDNLLPQTQTAQQIRDIQSTLRKSNSSFVSHWEITHSYTTRSRLSNWLRNQRATHLTTTWRERPAQASSRLMPVSVNRSSLRPPSQISRLQTSQLEQATVDNRIQRQQRVRQSSILHSPHRTKANLRAPLSKMEAHVKWGSLSRASPLADKLTWFSRRGWRHVASKPVAPPQRPRRTTLRLQAQQMRAIFALLTRALSMGHIQAKLHRAVFRLTSACQQVELSEALARQRGPLRSRTALKDIIMSVDRAMIRIITRVYHQATTVTVRAIILLHSRTARMGKVIVT